MKKKIILMGIAGAMVLTFIIGGTMAGFTAQSEQGKTDIKTKQLGITLGDGEGVPLSDKPDDIEIRMPGEEVPAAYSVTNDVQEGYDLYTRVTIYKYWEDHPDELDPELIHLYAGKETDRQELTAGTAVNGWLIWYADAEQVIAYYTKPLATGEVTSNILDSISVSAEVDNSYTDKKVMLDITADAVQKAVAESSIPAEWGVYPEFDADGNITGIKEVR